EADIGNIPQTDAERLAKALPFPGWAESYDFGRNYLSLGFVFFERGYYEQSEAFFQQAVKNDPASAEALYGLGSAFLQQNKSKEAGDCFEKALHLHARYPGTLPNAWNNLGILAARERNTAAAIQHFQHALQIDPQHAIAFLYLRTRRTAEAIRSFEESIRIAPAYDQSYLNLASVYVIVGDREKAKAILQQLLTQHPYHTQAKAQLKQLEP